MTQVSIKSALAGDQAVNSEVTIKGWIRTTRDSKGGFSFLVVHDGSCFDGIQVVANNELPNYDEEVLKLFTGCRASRQSAHRPRTRSTRRTDTARRL